MPVIGYKKVFKQIKGVADEIFIVNFNLKYNKEGFLEIKDESDSYFDVGDFRIKLDTIFNEFTEEMLKKYDNGVYILSICKYIVDKIPNLYSINYESKGMIDTYYKQEIIDDYNKISINKEKNNNSKYSSKK